MAEIISSKKQSRRKTKDPRIDLTPMVDLGFLLITFFIYTTTMAEPKIIKLTMPDNEPTPHPTVFPDECTITLIPTKAHKIIYYTGALYNISQLQESNFSANGIRNVLLEKSSTVKHLPANFSTDAHQLHIIVKPADDCTYQDVISIMDETNIASAPYTAITDLSLTEKEMLRKKLP